MAIKTMTKMARTNQKIRAWMISSGYEDITFFPHTRYQKDIHFQGESFDGIASLKNTLVLFQAKTNTRATKRVLLDYEEISTRMGISCLWINAIDRKGLEVNNDAV